MSKKHRKKNNMQKMSIEQSSAAISKVLFRNRQNKLRLNINKPV